MVAYQSIFEGPRAKDLTIGRILNSHREEQMILLQPCAPLWQQTRIVHKPLYVSPYCETLDSRGAERRS